MSDNTKLHLIKFTDKLLLFSFSSHGQRLLFSVTVIDYSAVQQLERVVGPGAAEKAQHTHEQWERRRAGEHHGEGERASAPASLTKLGQLIWFKVKQETTEAKINHFLGVFLLHWNTGGVIVDSPDFLINSQTATHRGPKQVISTLTSAHRFEHMETCARSYAACFTVLMLWGRFRFFCSSTCSQVIWIKF